MNIDTVDFGFEAVEITPRKACVKRANEVWLLQGQGSHWNQVYISGDVMDKCGWGLGTRLELMKSKDGRTLAFKGVNHGASFEIKYTNSNNTARINSAELARTMRALMAVKFGTNCDVKRFSVQVVDNIAVLTPEFDEL